MALRSALRTFIVHIHLEAIITLCLAVQLIYFHSPPLNALISERPVCWPLSSQQHICEDARTSNDFSCRSPPLSPPARLPPTAQRRTDSFQVQAATVTRKDKRVGCYTIKKKIQKTASTSAWAVFTSAERCRPARRRHAMLDAPPFPRHEKCRRVPNLRHQVVMRRLARLRVFVGCVGRPEEAKPTCTGCPVRRGRERPARVRSRRACCRRGAASPCGKASGRLTDAAPVVEERTTAARAGLVSGCHIYCCMYCTC